MLGKNSYKAPIGFKTVRQAVEILGISNATFYKYVAKGEIKVKKLLGKTLVSDEEIRRLTSVN